MASQQDNKLLSGAR